MPARDASSRHQAVDRANIDDAAPAVAFDHRLADEFGAEKSARQIQIHERAPFFQGHVLRRYVLAASAHVVDENVDGPVRKSCLARLLALFGNTDVPLNDPCLTPKYANVGGGLLQA